MINKNKYSLLLLCMLLGVLLNSFPAVAGKKTYKYQIKENDEPVLLTEEQDDDGRRTYTFTSLPHYYLLLESQEPVSYNDCNCDDCSHEASSSFQSRGHQIRCLAHGIFGYRFSAARTAATEANTDPECNNTEDGRSVVMNLTDILRPLMEYYDSQRGSRACSSYFFEVSWQRTLDRLRAIDWNNCLLVPALTSEVTVLIPPALLINTPDSETPDISPLAYILNPYSALNDQGHREISFELRFLRTDDPQSGRKFEGDMMGNYRINLVNGQFRLTIARDNASDFEVTGNIFSEEMPESESSPITNNNDYALNSPGDSDQPDVPQNVLSESTKFRRRPMGGWHSWNRKIRLKALKELRSELSMEAPKSLKIVGYPYYILRHKETMTAEELHQYRPLPGG